MLFKTLPRARHSTRRNTPRSSHRLSLERLEDRLVPTSAIDGDVLVATLPSQGFTQADQSGFPTGLVGVRLNPTPPPTTTQYQLSTDQVLGSGNYFIFPTYTAQATNSSNQFLPQLFETDLQYNLGNATAGGTATALNDTSKSWRANQFAGGIFQVLDNNGNVLQQRFVISNTATQITVDHAFSPIPPTGQRYQVYGLGAIIAIDSNSGAQSVLALGGGTSSGGNSSTTLNDTTSFAPWLPNQFAGLTVQITSGTGVGQSRVVSSNTATQLTIGTAWATVPDATSTFQVGYINGPNALLFKNGFLYVANEAQATGAVHSLVRVDPNTGVQKLISDGSSGGFSIAVGMGQVPNNGDPNNLYVADEPGNVQGSDPGKVWKININTGVQTIISQNGSQGFLFNHPVDMAVEASGSILVVNTGAGGFNGNVFRIDPATGNQSLVGSFSGAANGGLDSIDVGAGPFGSGTIFVGAISYTGADARMYAVDPVAADNNTPTVIADDTDLSEVEGIRVFHAPVQSNNPPNVTAPSNQTASEGSLQPFNLGSFSDASGGTWTATINWGDGSSNTIFNPSAPGPLTGQSHTYAEERTFAVTITVTNNSDNLFGSGMFQVSVSDPNVMATGGLAISATEGVLSAVQTVATFTDPAGPEAADGTHYSASINWGDNTAATVGSIALNGTTFTVS
ncbi:MAG TPA: hypothetical protein VKU02_12365, partial [Gemmataceae bacterium]|nr:hypothetical protein [Gemmataceae bacterium]